MMPISQIEASEAALRAYCERHNFLGWDPWDALGSPLFGRFPLNQRLPRWAANHLLKIAPVNVRPLLGIRKDCFAKGLALCMSAYLLRQKCRSDARNLEICKDLRERLEKKKIGGYSGPCWGTNLAYQTRAFFVPPDTPSAVHTAFAVEALLDLNEIAPDPGLVDMALGACHFALRDLTITDAPDGIYFSYTPRDRTKVINVTALVARMLARTGALVKDNVLLKKSRQAAAWVVSCQAADGSWPYGLDPVHHWIDNYHTGFVLEALEDYLSYTGDTRITGTIDKGSEFYRKQLFLEDGTPKFSPGAVYPVDGHCLAQGILTFTRLKHRNEEYLSFAEKIAEWGRCNFQHPDGYFYYQRRRMWLNRIPYIRWVQAWMVLALNRLIYALKSEESSAPRIHS
jgi:hypothetical protein